MKRTTIYPLFLALTIIFTACSGNVSGSIQQITPLPTDTPVNDPTDVPQAPPTVGEAATSTPTMTPPPTNTLSAAQQLFGKNAAENQGPLDNDLPAGNAREIAAATDAAYQPTPNGNISITFTEDPVPLQFNEFYESYDLRQGLTFSDKLVALDGKRVVMEGYLAPPLKPKIDFIVLTKIPLAFCPFCSSDADWPDDIALLYLPSEIIVDTRYPARVEGRLEIGSQMDAETGMVSLVRIYVVEFDPITTNQTEQARNDE